MVSPGAVRHSSTGGFFEIITPAGARRRVQALDSAWQALSRYKDSASWLREELRAWERFRDSVLESYFDLMTASGAMAELDDWEARYKDAYKRLGGPQTAPNPDSLHLSEPVSPWVYAIACASVAVVGIALIFRRN